MTYIPVFIKIVSAVQKLVGEITDTKIACDRISLILFLKIRKVG
jgi:hypothetical protein